MFEKLQSIEARYLELRDMMMDPKIVSDNDKVKRISKEMSNLEELYQLFQWYKVLVDNLNEANDILVNESDPEMVDMAKEQLTEATAGIEEYDEKIKIALLPKDPNDDKNIFLEMRPAAWGDEAGLFASELMRAYMLYAQKEGWKTEVVEQQLSDIGGLKFAMLKMTWEKVYSKLKRESGVHRVQRIPKTETQGRVHTSTITVAVLPEVDDVDFEFDSKEVEMDTFAASSAGGQNANKNQTWVRLRHQPSGIIVTIADSKSQLQNKEKAFAILKSKLYQLEVEKQEEENREARSNQIGSGGRSEKIRTYNFPQDRVTDHRIKQSRSNIPGILDGQIDDIVNAVVVENQTKLLEQAWGENQ